MVRIGYHASHEQFKPSELLHYAKLAVEAGFEFINCSDHFHPWSKRQGQSGFSFAWLGAAMQAIDLPFGVVCAPGQRYHPAIVAQAVATLCEMFPQRFWIAVGSGEALNERITGDKWPTKTDRNIRLKECVDIMRRLFRGETVSHYGSVVVEEAKLYTLPEQAPMIVGAAVSAATAEWMGAWADGLVTVSAPLPELQKIVDAFRKGGGNDKPMYLKVQLSYANSEKDALEGAFEQWRTHIFSGSVLGDLWKVEHFDALGEMVQPDELRKMINISADLDFHAQQIKQYVNMGFDKILLHNVNRGQETFIRTFGREIITRFRK